MQAKEATQGREVIFRSRFPTQEIPVVPYTHFIFEKAKTYGDKPALIDSVTKRTITYRQFVNQAVNFALHLHSRGFRRGDVLAVISPNLPEYAVVFHGVLLVGGILTTINPLYTIEEIVKQLKHSQTSYIFTTNAMLDKMQIAKEQSFVKDIILLVEEEPNRVVPDTIPYQEFVSPLGNLDERDLPQILWDPLNDIAALPYSSGTTGLPKGVMLTHHNLVANIITLNGVEGATFTSKDVVNGVLPFFHIYGMQILMNFTLWKGATIVTMPRYQLEPFLQVCQDYKVTRGYLVPPIILQLAKDPIVDKYDLSSMKIINCGAAPLGLDIQELCSKRIKVVIKQGYGLTETSPTTHTFPDDPKLIKPASIGLLICNTLAKIVDPATGESVGPNKLGELWISGPQVMKGYFNNVEATNATIDQQGWLHTGDIGYADEEGYFYVVDRLKELIKYKGMQVAPAELEALLLSHPAVDDAAVVPYPDEEAGEVPKAFVVLKPGHTSVTQEEIKNFIKAKVATYKQIRIIEFIDKIPKSPSGKILRRTLVPAKPLPSHEPHKARL